MHSHWKINRDTKTHLYQQIANIIASDIHSKRLTNGIKLPSQRTLMNIFKVSRNIIILAIERLAKENLVTIKAQSGAFVSNNPSQTGVDWDKYFSHGRFKAGTEGRVEQITHIGQSRGKVINISAAGLGCEYNLLQPVIELLGNKILNKDLSTLNHFDKYGYLPLREAIAKHVSEHGIKATSKNILIMPSVLQSINIISTAFTHFGMDFVYATPNIINADSTVHFLGCNLIPLEMDEKGILPERLLSTLRNRKSFLYLNPTSQNPTGKTMELSRRYEILDIAERTKTPIIEVDSLRDIWIDSPYPPSLRALSNGGNVIYLGSMLRALTLNLRISWVIADEEVIEKIGNIKVQSDIFPSIILQLIANELLSGGMYKTFLDEIRPLMSKRMNDALSLIDKYFNDVATWNINDCKYYIWLKFNNEISVRRLFETVRSVEFYPGFFYDKNDNSHISICPAGVTFDELEESLKELNSIIRRLFY